MATGTAVETGASTGIGAAACRHRVGPDLDVLAGVRPVEDAERLQAWLGRVLPDRAMDALLRRALLGR